MPRKLVGVRLEQSVHKRFRELCEREQNGLGYAVQRLMELAIAVGGVEKLAIAASMIEERLEKANKLALKHQISELDHYLHLSRIQAERGDRYLTYSGLYRDRIDKIIELIPQVRDNRLTAKAEALIEKAQDFYHDFEAKREKQ